MGKADRWDVLTVLGLVALCQLEATVEEGPVSLDAAVDGVCVFTTLLPEASQALKFVLLFCLASSLASFIVVAVETLTVDGLLVACFLR